MENCQQRESGAAAALTELPAHAQQSQTGQNSPVFGGGGDETAQCQGNASSAETSIIEWERWQGSAAGPQRRGG